MIQTILVAAAVILASGMPFGDAYALDVGDSLPNIALPRDDGTALNAHDLRGKVVLIDFWASWCAPCKRSLPWLNQLRDRYGDDNLTIVTVNVDADPERARALGSTISGAIIKVKDPSGDIAQAFDVQRMPSSYLVDEDLRVVSVQRGFSSTEQEQVEARLKALGVAQRRS